MAIHKRITLSADECALAHSAFTYLVEQLAVDMTNHGSLTKWACKEMRARLMSLRAEFEEPSQ